MSRKLSANFTLAEMCVTSTGLLNVPGPADVARIEKFVQSVLQPARNAVGGLRVTSGFRSWAVNEAVGGEDASAHLKGNAADVQPLDMLLEDAWKILVGMIERGELLVDQAIIYQRKRGSGWIHIGVREGRPRGEILVNPAGSRKYPLAKTFTGPLILP